MKKNWLKKINRQELVNLDRSNYLRLDKNERVIDFEKRFLNYLKKNLNTYTLSAYPDLYKIKKTLSKHIKAPIDSIFLSAGSDIAIKTCIELFTNQGSKIIILDPTFGMVNVYCALYDLKPIKIKYSNILKLDTQKLLKNISSKISLIILANPNSPTGTIINKKIMFRILKKSNKYRVPIVIDEAYDGFYSFSYKKYIKKFNNLIIVRTFSKSFGLAGLRVGFTISNKKITALLNKFRPMYEINSIASLAIKFLVSNYFIVRKHIKDVLKAKKYLIKELKKMNIEFIDTHANFFHIKFKKDIKIVEKLFKKNQILVRKGPGVNGFEKFLRFSLGSKKQMKNIIQIIKNKF